MLDYGKLVTKKGSKIETHFEDDIIKAKFERFSKQDVKSLIRTIDMCGIDTGKQTIHLAINNQMAIKIMSEEDYSHWQAEPKKDWFHLSGFELDLPELLLAISIGDLLGDMISDLIYDNKEYRNSFTGATVEEFELLRNNSGMRECLIAIAIDRNCVCCPSPYCSTRTASFNKVEFEKLTSDLNKK